ncbi:TetR/AcrR family transcriptional regulator [Bradymonadaceae bacterium TMQ3]|uniref:TetR/AcrR family transcriptional regulator n=2 Tax=Lujinxingia sediminis TaxID=2480984 RepID=A0ABY0CSP9_9DELT|nr:TetR/AcrR family transcriptional regulator [Bradymonadaceae bacterium TMQ3]RVU43556.1 TetR/AcrR family transcriptional regulator [Lujinxingia sediminis]TXC75915.1 TetR/AcrR family transcriptional regulator [Bradymonadales bacterium TMQ1]
MGIHSASLTPVHPLRDLVSMADSEKQRGSSEKRERILEGALRAFAKKGFYNTRVSEIASEAGVADGTIYLYFKNKDDLLISLFEDRMEWIIARLQTELDAVDGGVIERIKAFVHLHFRLAVEDRDLAEFITVELRQSSKFVKEYKNPKFADYLKILQSLIDQGQNEGIFRTDLDSRLVGRALFGALDEVLLQFTLSRSAPTDVRDEAEQISTMIIDGLIVREHPTMD